MEIEIVKEYRLTVVKTIWESIGGTKAAYKKAGSTLLVNEETYQRLLHGLEVSTFTLVGMGEYATVKYNASYFGPTVEITEKHWYTTAFSPLKTRKTRRKNVNN